MNHVGTWLLQILVVESGWSDLGQGSVHLVLVLEAGALTDQQLQEGEALLTLVDGRVFHSLTHQLLRVVHHLHCLMAR